MQTASREQITRLLLDWNQGSDEALAALFPLVYEELRSMARSHLRRERRSHTLQRTALVHEAFLRLVDQKHVSWQSRAQFFGLASRMMRRILVDHARRRSAAKRGAKAVRVDLEELIGSEAASAASGGDAGPAVDFGDVDDALKKLEQLDPRQGRLVELRFFGGLSLEESAAIIGVSPATAKRDWTFARAWLLQELSAEGAPGPSPAPSPRH